MSGFYCDSCGRKRSFSATVVPSNPTGTSDQLKKYVKHTQPPANYPVNSVFDTANPGTYQGYMLSASASGFFEQDSKGRISRIWYAGNRVGQTISAGSANANSGVKVVCGEFPYAIHAFPTASDAFISGVCLDCGLPLVDHR